MPSLLRLRGQIRHVVPTTVDEAGKRHGGFGFARCDGVIEGDLDPDQPSPIGVDHFTHLRDTGASSIEQMVGKRVSFVPVAHPKGPRATEVEVLE